MIPVIYPNYYPHQTTYSKRDNVATIVTTKIGTFSSTWKGSGTLYFDPGDGGPIEPLVLTADGVNWDHEYLLAGSKTIKITGDLLLATSMYIRQQGVVNNIEDIVFNFKNLTSLSLHLNSITGDIAAISKLKLDFCVLRSNNLNFSCAEFETWDGTFYYFDSTLSTSEEIGNLLIALANSGMNNCILYLDGTNPAPPSTQDVIDGISTLIGNGVTLYVNT